MDAAQEQAVMSLIATLQAEVRDLQNLLNETREEIGILPFHFDQE